MIKVHTKDIHGKDIHGVSYRFLLKLADWKCRFMADIYTIETKMDSVIEFLQDRIEHNTMMYKPTKNRMKLLLEKCTTAVELITEILQENTLQDEEEFENAENTEIQENQEQIDEILNTLYQLTGKYESITDKPIGNSKNQKTSKSSTTLSKSEKKFILVQYKDCIANLEENTSDSEIGYLKECAFMIKQWFDARYKFGERDFKYDVRTIPTWICGIVITYGQNIMHNTTQDFVMEFLDWIDNVDEDPMYCKYPVPYDIFMNSKDVKAKNIPLASLVLWDLLYDNGLNALEDSKVPMKRNSIKNMAKITANDNGCFKDYRYYKDNKNILYKSRLLIRTKDTGGNENAES